MEEQSKYMMERKVVAEEPRLYRVLVHNDHYTTMDFVVEMLMRIFDKSEADAVKIMLDTHHLGYGVCGIYTLDLAMTKVTQVHRIARMRGFPLKCSYEEV